MILKHILIPKIGRTKPDYVPHVDETIRPMQEIPTCPQSEYPSVMWSI